MPIRRLVISAAVALLVSASSLTAPLPSLARVQAISKAWTPRGNVYGLTARHRSEAHRARQLPRGATDRQVCTAALEYARRELWRRKLPTTQENILRQYFWGRADKSPPVLNEIISR